MHVLFERSIDCTKEAMDLDASWQSVLRVLPLWMRDGVDRMGRDSLRQLRLRLGAPPKMELSKGSWCLPGRVSREDLDFCINAASDYSPWTAYSARFGFLTLPGGHRMGICGMAIQKDGECAGFRQVTSLCLRVARDIGGLVPPNCGQWGSTLILGAPGWGKTTLLRDLCRVLSRQYSVAVVDTRAELFPEGISQGQGVDVLIGCEKKTGMEMVLTTMAPDYIALDEVTAEVDAQALLQASGCGVRLLATAHAERLEDLTRRPCYREIAQSGIFETALILSQDKTYHRERMELWSTNGLGQFSSSADAAASALP